MARSHADILADIAKTVVEQHRATRKFTTGQGQTTTDPEAGNVPVPLGEYENFIPAGARWKVCTDCGRRYLASATCRHGRDPSWNYTLPEEYQG